MPLRSSNGGVPASRPGGDASRATWSVELPLSSNSFGGSARSRNTRSESGILTASPPPACSLTSLRRCSSVSIIVAVSPDTPIDAPSREDKSVGPEGARSTAIRPAASPAALTYSVNRTVMTPEERSRDGLPDSSGGSSSIVTPSDTPDAGGIALPAASKSVEGPSDTRH